MSEEQSNSVVLENEDLPALLWDKMPDDPSSHPDFMAIQSLTYDESTPLEQMENFKDQGNQRLKAAVQSKNKIYFHEAIKYYTKGLEVESEDHQSLRAVLYSNRAQAQIYLKNWRKALNDSQLALKLDSGNLKACYRGARAALKLDEVSKALELCEDGLRIDRANTELIKIMKEAQTRAAVIKSEQERIDKEKAILHKEAVQLIEEFSKRNIRLCQSNFKVGKLKPIVDGEGLLHWPVLFVYPESMQQDLVEDVCETDTLSEHLDIMFSASIEPLQWDAKNEYARNNIEVYYLANAGKPFDQDELLDVLEGRYQGDPELHSPEMYGENAAYFVKVKEDLSIHEILSEANCIVPGVPTFFIVAKGSNYHQRFLESITNV